MNSKYILDFIKEYKSNFIDNIKIETTIDSNNSDLLKISQKHKKLILDKNILSKNIIEDIFNKIESKSKEKLQIAITGQFSAGKSTFLNALLKDDILPTGIVPVTSKINYLKYSPEYKLKVNYKCGKIEYKNIKYLSSIIDQRENINKDIKYLTIYAPSEILKNITFIDTPGLNSTSKDDTQNTLEILNSVDGIIWLTLIDNAGKRSEEEILEKYMVNFKNKTLCILNQKDKFSSKQIKTTIGYIKDKFNIFFNEVIAISSKQAIQSIKNSKKYQIKIAIENIKKDFKKSIDENYDKSTLDFFKNNFIEYSNKIKNIKSKNENNNIELLENSNIKEVLTFIEKNIKKESKNTKKESTLKYIKNIYDKLITEYNVIIKTYTIIIDELKENENKILIQFNNIKEKNYIELLNIYNSLENILNTISIEIVNNIKENKSYRYKENKKYFSKKLKIDKIEYETFEIDSNNIYNKLFYNDPIIEKMLKNSIKLLKKVELESITYFNNIYINLKNSIKQCEKPYEKTQDKKDIINQKIFNETKDFISKIYENIIRNYHKTILENIAALKKKFGYFNGALSYNNIQITKNTVNYFENKIQQSVELYEKEPLKFNIYTPKKDEILNRLKDDFRFDKIEEFLISKNNSISRIIKYSKQNYKKINDKNIKLLEKNQKKLLDNIEYIKLIISNI